MTGVQENKIFNTRIMKPKIYLLNENIAESSLNGIITYYYIIRAENKKPED